MFTRTTRLVELNFANNQLTSTLPSSLGNLRDLSEYSDFYLSSPMLPSVTELTVVFCFLLELCSFAKNHLTGPLPMQINLMLDLETFSIENNKISGTIPIGISSLRDLQTFTANNNKLTGTIPTYFGVLNRLRVLRLSQNRLIGTVPSELGFLKDLQTLRVDGNQLTGVIPDDICSLVQDYALTFLASDCGKGTIECSCCQKCF